MKVLIFESDEDLARQLQREFSDAGCTATWLQYPPEHTADAVCGEHPDVITMDIVMDRIDGLQATKIIKSDPRTEHIPILIYSSISSPAYVREGLSSGAAAYYCKAEVAPQLLVRHALRITSPKGAAADQS